MLFIAVQNGRVSYFVPVLESIGSKDRCREWLLVARTSHETKAFPCVRIAKIVGTAVETSRLVGWTMTREKAVPYCGWLTT